MGIEFELDNNRNFCITITGIESKLFHLILLDVLTTWNLNEFLHWQLPINMSTAFEHDSTLGFTCFSNCTCFTAWSWNLRRDMTSSFLSAAVSMRQSKIHTVIPMCAVALLRIPVYIWLAVYVHTHAKHFVLHSSRILSALKSNVSRIRTKTTWKRLSNAQLRGLYDEELDGRWVIQLHTSVHTAWSWRCFPYTNNAHIQI